MTRSTRSLENQGIRDQRDATGPNGDSDLPHKAEVLEINQTWDIERQTDGQTACRIMFEGDLVSGSSANASFLASQDDFLLEGPVVASQAVSARDISPQSSGTSSFVDVHEPLISQGLQCQELGGS